MLSHRSMSTQTKLIASVTLLLALAGNSATLAQVHAGLAASPWPKFRCDLRNSGHPGAGVTSGAVLWTFTAIGADGTVYIGSDDGSVYALDQRTGTKRWAYPTGGPVSSSPAIAMDGTVYADSGNGKVYAFAAATPFTIADAARALAVAAGLAPTDPVEVARLDIVKDSPASLEIADAIGLARKAGGLDPNP